MQNLHQAFNCSNEEECSSSLNDAYNHSGTLFPIHFYLHYFY